MNCFGLLNDQYCKFDPGDDWEDDHKWKKILGIYTHVTGKDPHKIFEEEDWLDTIMFDLDIIMYFWNEVYSPLISGGRRGL